MDANFLIEWNDQQRGSHFWKTLWVSTGSSKPSTYPIFQRWVLLMPMISNINSSIESVCSAVGFRLSPKLCWTAPEIWHPEMEEEFYSKNLFAYPNWLVLKHTRRPRASYRKWGFDVTDAQIGLEATCRWCSCIFGNNPLKYWVFSFLAGDEMLGECTAAIARTVEFQCTCDLVLDYGSVRNSRFSQGILKFWEDLQSGISSREFSVQEVPSA